jgi:hypothetical protein
VPDETIFCWDWGHFHRESRGDPTGALALSPAEFTEGRDLLDSRSTPNFESCVSQRYESSQRLAFHITLTNQGILIELPLYSIDDLNGLALAVLNVCTKEDGRRVALPLVHANQLYSNIFTKAPGSTLFILPKEYSPPPSHERIYIQHWAAEDWGTAPSLESDHPLGLSLHLIGDTWSKERWHCHGWYPPIPLNVDTFLAYYDLFSEPHPPHFLVIFGNQTCSILCFFVTTKTEYSFEVQVRLTTVMTPALTPLDVLYSQTTQKVEISHLERFKWTILDGESTLSVGQRTVHGVVEIVPGGQGYDPRVDIELRLT